MLYWVVYYGFYGVISFTTIYIPGLFFAKTLESLRATLLDVLVWNALRKYPDLPITHRTTADEKKKQLQQVQVRNKLISFQLLILNKFFLVNMGRITLALVWGVLQFIVAVIM